MVLALGRASSEAVTLLAAFCLYDMASFVMGTGPLGGPIGVLAGWLSIGALALFVAAVVVPPYSGRNPWILLGLVAALAPVGVVLCAAHHPRAAAAGPATAGLPGRWPARPG